MPRDHSAWTSMAEIPVVPTLSHYSQLKLHFFFISMMNTKASLQLLLFPQPISLPHHILTNPYEEEEEKTKHCIERERGKKKLLCNYICCPTSPFHSQNSLTK